MSTEEDTQLQQVSALFHDHIRLVRSQQILVDREKLAEEWLKATRITIMEKLEKKYQEMTQNSDPEQAPDWAVDPRQPLTLFTESFKACLEPYTARFLKELKTLMDNCGFNAQIRTFDRSFVIKISFPEDHASTKANVKITQPVEKEENSVKSRGEKQRGIVDRNGREIMNTCGPGMVIQVKLDEFASTTEQGSKDVDDSEDKSKRSRRTKSRRKRGKKSSRR